MVQHVRDEQHDADQHRNQEPQQPHPGAASRHEQNEVEHKETLHWVQTGPREFFLEYDEGPCTRIESHKALLSCLKPSELFWFHSSLAASTACAHCSKRSAPSGRLSVRCRPASVSASAAASAGEPLPAPPAHTASRLQRSNSCES
jgi:hypothetical protein